MCTVTKTLFPGAKDILKCEGGETEELFVNNFFQPLTFIVLSAEPVTNHWFPGSTAIHLTQPKWPLITFKKGNIFFLKSGKIHRSVNKTFILQHYNLLVLTEKHMLLKTIKSEIRSEKSLIFISTLVEIYVIHHT